MTAAEEDDDEEVICAILSKDWGGSVHISRHLWLRMLRNVPDNLAFCWAGGV